MTEVSTVRRRKSWSDARASPKVSPGPEGSESDPANPLLPGRKASHQDTSASRSGDSLCLVARQGLLTRTAWCPRGGAELGGGGLRGDLHWRPSWYTRKSGKEENSEEHRVQGRAAFAARCPLHLGECPLSVHCRDLPKRGGGLGASEARPEGPRCWRPWKVGGLRIPAGQVAGVRSGGL